LKILKDKKDLSKQALSFLFSILIHAALFCLLIYFFPSIRVIALGQKVRDVIIVSPEKLFLPDLEEELPEIEDIDEFLLRRAQERKHAISRIKNLTERKEQSSDIQDKAAEITINPRFPLEFSIDKTPERKEKAPSRDAFNFSLKPEEEQIQSRETEKNIEKEAPNLSKYIHSGYSRTSSTGSGSLFPSSRGSSWSRGSIASSIKDIDIAPWAENVIHQVQKNWSIPSAQEFSKKSSVEILVVIRKNGEISHIKVNKSSQVEVLDQAALNAINTSSPMLKLPDDFPYEYLEISLVFQYND